MLFVYSSIIKLGCISFLIKVKVYLSCSAAVVYWAVKNWGWFACVCVSDICHRVQTQEFTYNTIRIKDILKSQIFLYLCMLAQQKLPPDLNLLELEEYRDKLKRQQAAVSIAFKEIFEKQSALSEAVCSAHFVTYCISLLILHYNWYSFISGS